MYRGGISYRWGPLEIRCLVLNLAVSPDQNIGGFGGVLEIQQICFLVGMTAPKLLLFKLFNFQDWNGVSCIACNKKYLPLMT